MEKEITLTEQEVLFLDDWLQQELESRFISDTSRFIITNLVKKLNK